MDVIGIGQIIEVLPLLSKRWYEYCRKKNGF
jgi:hypothetical protein